VPAQAGMGCKNERQKTMQLLILSDIHGNVSALTSVLEDVQNKYKINALALLGDCIDYGMRSNMVIQNLQKIRWPVICSLWGNHEQAIMKEDFTRFSSLRGVLSAQNTKKHLSMDSFLYLDNQKAKCGYEEFIFSGKQFLAVHGSLEDPYWKAITPGSELEGYEKYDYVLSGHNHIPHAFSVFYQVNDPAMRNKKKTCFINPGSVGQPRNHDPRAQYAVLDTEYGIHLNAVAYDISYEQSLFTDEIDSFYRDRLSNGI